MNVKTFLKVFICPALWELSSAISLINLFFDVQTAPSTQVKSRTHPLAKRKGTVVCWLSILKNSRNFLRIHSDRFSDTQKEEWQTNALENRTSSRHIAFESNLSQPLTFRDVQKQCWRETLVVKCRVVWKMTYYENTMKNIHQSTKIFLYLPD